MQKRTTQIWGAAGAIFLALLIAAFLASIARSSRSLGAALVETSMPIIGSGQITVVVVAQRQVTDQATISPERRVRNRRNVARALATSAIPVIPSLSEADEQLIVSDGEAPDPEIAFDLAQGIGGPLPASADAGARAPVTLVPIATVTRVGNVTIVPTIAVATQPPAAPGAPAQPNGASVTPVRTSPTATASAIAPNPEASKTPIAPTASPAPIATSGAPTKPPATEIPTTVLPTAVVTIAPPSTPRPTAATATPAPPTSAPATVRPTTIPPTPIPPTDVPTVTVPPTASATFVSTAPPTAIPSTATPPPPTITPRPEPSATLEPVTNLHIRVYSSDNHSAQMGWQITVFRQGSDDMLAAAATDASGAVHFTMQPTGTRICVVAPSGWRVVYPAEGCYYQSLPSGDVTLEFVVAPQR